MAQAAGPAARAAPPPCSAHNGSSLEGRLLPPWVPAGRAALRPPLGLPRHRRGPGAAAGRCQAPHCSHSGLCPPSQRWPQAALVTPALGREQGAWARGRRPVSVQNQGVFTGRLGHSHRPRPHRPGGLSHYLHLKVGRARHTQGHSRYAPGLGKNSPERSDSSKVPERSRGGAAEASLAPPWGRWPDPGLDQHFTLRTPGLVCPDSTLWLLLPAQRPTWTATGQPRPPFLFSSGTGD